MLPACAHIYLYSAANGTALHNKKHTCTSDDQAGCVSKDKKEAWATTDEEYIKFGARLIIQKGVEMRNKVINRYKIAWAKLHPDEEVPLTSEDEPIDFLWESIHPCEHIPWMAGIPKSNRITGKFKFQDLFLLFTRIHIFNPDPPLKAAPSPPAELPTATDQAASSSASSDKPFFEELSYLSSCAFTVSLADFPKIANLFPGLKEYIPEKPKLLAYFVLGPEYQFDPDVRAEDCYCTTAELDDHDFATIWSVSPLHIKKIEKLKNGRVKCYYNAWVRFRLF